MENRKDFLGVMGVDWEQEGSHDREEEKILGETNGIAGACWGVLMYSNGNMMGFAGVTPGKTPTKGGHGDYTDHLL